MMATTAHRGVQPTSQRRNAVVLTIVIVVVAWFLYRPDRSRSFDLLDFGEFVPIVKHADTWWEQFTSLLRYNVVKSGRANVIQVFAAVAKWNWFGDWMAGWQLTRAVVMVVVFGQSIALLRRLGVSSLGAVAGASVYLVAPAAARGWIRVTVAEPFAMIVVLALALRATRFQNRNAWWQDVALFSAGSAFVILTKELMAPALLLPLFLAIAVKDGDVVLPTLSRRNVALITVVGLVSVLTLLPLMLVFFTASPTAFASQYGSSTQSLGFLLTIWLSPFLPFNPFSQVPNAMWVTAMISAVVTIAAGWWLVVHDENDTRTAQGLFLAAALFPLLGALAYAGWPSYEERYAYPYLIGPAFILGISLSKLERVSLRGKLAGMFCWLIMFILGAADASASASRSDAAQRTVDGVISTVAASSEVDSVFVATDFTPVPAWTGLGPTLYRLAEATDRPWAATRDIRCLEIEAALTRTRVAIVAFPAHCATPVPATHRIATAYRFIDWRRWELGLDSVKAGIVVTPRRIGNEQR